MARITVEDCLTKETNRFALVQLAAKRTKQILQGGKVLITDTRGNKPVVTSLREIAEGRVRFMTKEEMAIALEEEAKQQASAIEAALTGVPPPAPNGDTEKNGGRAALFQAAFVDDSATTEASPKAQAAVISDDDDDDDDDDDEIIDTSTDGEVDGV